MKERFALYIGGFEMPDKNAAAQRVLSIAKVLNAVGFSVHFYGVTKTHDYAGVVDNFSFHAQDYPVSSFAWVKYEYGFKIIDYIKQIKPAIVLLYNYPVIAQERIIWYCRRSHIKVIGDITEWYQSNSLIKSLDSTIRMRWSNKHLDGIISISRYIHDYYKKYYSILVPPLVDKSECKWNESLDEGLDTDCIRLVYVGNPGLQKDRLDYIINGINKAGSDRFILNVIGITEQLFLERYGNSIDRIPPSIVFHGRISHNRAISMLRMSDFQIFFRDNTLVNNAGFPTKLVESISAGVPVITNKTSNISDYIENGKNGFLINDLSEEDIVMTLRNIGEYNRNDIIQMKNSINSMLFDYNNYITLMADYLSGIGL